ncbi:MAG: SDR family oxidoreductase [Ignavibacteriaceae bacterium]|nr:SDR family oxidoreductase [Ignavibacteriaceae bacterium]
MNVKGNTVLITGGATGIGLALVKEFVETGNEVIICSRRMNKLDEAKKLFPSIHTRQFDLALPVHREALYNWIKTDFPKLNILINNAGIQRAIDFRKGIETIMTIDNEIAINLEAPVQLCAYFIPLLLTQKEAAIINITSGLGFIPSVAMPVYSATKAALHSFSITLRRQLKDTSIKVFEIIPPMVDTDLDKGERKKRGQTYFGITPEQTAQESFEAFQKDEYEFAVGEAKNFQAGAKQNFEEHFDRMNKFFK